MPIGSQVLYDPTMVVPDHPLVALLQVILIDITLAGDNAIVVGLAASRVAPDKRAKVIFWGIAGAVVLRVFLAAITVQLMAIVGLTLAGGILLLGVLEDGPRAGGRRVADETATVLAPDPQITHQPMPFGEGCRPDRYC